MVLDIYRFDSYKSYLQARLDGPDGLGKGGRSRLAEVIGCQTAFVSQVLKGPAHLSMEHGDAINHYFRHDDSESEYFLLLIQLARAGTPSLRSYLQRRLKKFIHTHQSLKHRLELPQGLPLERQVRYYSSWYYAAIHMATTVPELRTVDAIARRLGLNVSLVAKTVDFLVQASLIRRKGDRYEPVEETLHLGDDVDLVGRYHAQWRVRALTAIEQPMPDDLHYSAVFTLSQKDATKVREILVRALAESANVVKPSPAERMQAISVDWYAL